jgi:hypothetical protein
VNTTLLQRPLPLACRGLFLLSLLGMLALHLLEATWSPPAQYPHVMPLLFSIFSCGHFMLLLVMHTLAAWRGTVLKSFRLGKLPRPAAGGKAE